MILYSVKEDLMTEITGAQIINDYYYDNCNHRHKVYYLYVYDKNHNVVEYDEGGNPTVIPKPILMGRYDTYQEAHNIMLAIYEAMERGETEFCV